MQIAVPVIAYADGPSPGHAHHDDYASLDVLGRHEGRSGDISSLSHWSALLKRFEAPLHSTAPVSSGIAAWRAEIQSLKGLSPHEQIERVNDFMNKVPYIDDYKRYGQTGYWAATPVQ